MCADVVRQRSGGARVGDDTLQVGRGDRGLDVVHGLDAQRAQQQLGGLVEHPDDRAEHREVGLGRRRKRVGNLRRARDGEVLGEQLAQQHLDHGREGKRDERPDPDGGGGQRAAGQQRAERLADQRLGDVADQQAGDGDAQLRAGEQKGRAPRDVERALGGAVAVGRAAGQPGPVNRDVGELLGDEVGGGGGDQQDHGDADEQGDDRAHEAAPSGAGLRLWPSESDDMRRILRHTRRTHRPENRILRVERN